MKKLITALALIVTVTMMPITSMASELPADTTAPADNTDSTAAPADTTAPADNTDSTAAPADTTAPADNTDTTAAPADTTTETSEDLSASIVANESKPFLALGNDLTEDQLNYVLSEMGITKEQLSDYRVVYITNDMEHQYLDSYIDPSVIGSVSLSCVMVKENTEGTGIRVTTKNINYCTVSMYKNALLTAGVENADVLVVGPYPISGTAALIGAWQAYEEMTGEELEEEAKTVALAEMITTGDLTDALKDVDPEKVEELLDYIKAEVIANDLKDADDIKEVIENAQDKYNITLTEDQISKLTDLMKQIGGLDIDPKKLLEQAGDLYNKYGDTVLSEAKAALGDIITDEVKASFWDFLKKLFQSIINYIFGK